MPIESVYILGAGSIAVSGGEELSGFNQGSGIHLVGETITLLNNNWIEASVDETSNSDFNDSQSGSQKLEGNLTIDGVTYNDNTGVEAEYTVIVEDLAGNQYTLVAFNINQPGSPHPVYGTVEALAFVGGVGGFPPINEPLTVLSNQEGPAVPYTSLASPVCFAAGSMIATKTGRVAVEHLETGDRVLTMDHGYQTVRGVRSARLPSAVLQNNIRFAPIKVKQNAFGDNLPERDLYLSPQHRVLINGWQAELFYGETEILVPIHKLVNDRTILKTDGSTDVVYYHIIFDQHEIVFSDGLPTESYFLSESEIETPMAQEVIYIFGPLESPPTQAQTSARLIVDDKKTALLMQ